MSASAVPHSGPTEAAKTKTGERERERERERTKKRSLHDATKKTTREFYYQIPSYFHECEIRGIHVVIDSGYKTAHQAWRTS